MEGKERHGPAVPEPDADNRRSHPAPEEAEHPVPGVEHKPEPDAENIMPAEDQPGTF